MKAALTVCILAVSAAGCASLKPAAFADSRTKFDPEAYFTGHTRSWGVFENRGGEPVKRFTTDCFGKHDASGDLVLTQHFVFDGGKTQQRVWHVHRIDGHRYEATANDTVGKASGEAYGNAFRWEYNIALSPGNPLSTVHLRQWMYLAEGTQTLFTRVVVTKFGITVGEVAESFHHVPE